MDETIKIIARITGFVGPFIPYLIFILTTIFFAGPVLGNRLGISFVYTLLFSLLTIILSFWHPAFLNNTLYVILLLILTLGVLISSTSIITFPLIQTQRTSNSIYKEYENKFNDYLSKKQKMTSEEVYAFFGYSNYPVIVSSLNKPEMINLFEKMVQNGLIEKNITINRINGDFSILLTISDSNYDIRYLEILLKAGTDPNLLGQGEFMRSQLLTSRRFDKLKTLVKCGLDVDQKDFHGLDLIGQLKKERDSMSDKVQNQKDETDSLIKYIEDRKSGAIKDSC